MKNRMHRAALVLAVATATLVSSCNNDRLPPPDPPPCYPGSVFKAPDGCNTCYCESGYQVSCTTRVCLPDAGAGSLGQDASLVGGRGLPVRDAPAQDQSVAGDLVPADVDAGAEAVCFHSGGVLGVGESYFDGCNTCSCMAGGWLACTARPCPATGPASTAGCTVPTTLTSTYDGGHALYRDVNKLDVSGILTITRTWIDGPVTSCARALPPCGASGVVSAATIAADLAETDVQAAFAASSMSIYGLDDRLAGGAVYSIARGDGRIIYVGSPCTSTARSPCQSIPGGVQRLADDLKSLTSATLAAPACQGL